MKIAVCDDEEIIREQIRELIKKQEENCELYLYETGGALLAADVHFDMIFLDIQLEDMNGIDAARALRERKDDTVLIFVTGIREYVFEAFDVSAFHYLLKPLEEVKFASVFGRAREEVLKHRERGRKYLFIQTKKRKLTIERDSILYIENRGKKVEIHTMQEVIEIYAVMNALEEELGGEFYRCHRGYLVNLGCIAEYSRDQISLHNGERIFLAKGKYNGFVNAYMQYLKNGGTVCV